jgi:hypothetical protein
MRTQGRQIFGSRQETEGELFFKFKYKWMYRWLCTIENLSISLFPYFPVDEECEGTGSFTWNVFSWGDVNPQFERGGGRGGGGGDLLVGGRVIRSPVVDFIPDPTRVAAIR